MYVVYCAHIVQSRQTIKHNYYAHGKNCLNRRPVLRSSAVASLQGNRAEAAASPKFWVFKKLLVNFFFSKQVDKMQNTKLKPNFGKLLLKDRKLKQSLFFLSEICSCVSDFVKNLWCPARNCNFLPRQFLKLRCRWLFVHMSTDEEAHLLHTVLCTIHGESV